MNIFNDSQVIVRGGGDLATGVIYRLRAAGVPVLVLETETARRTASGRSEIGRAHV